MADKFANGFLGYWIVSKYSKNEKALQWIISLIPIGCSLGCTLATWIGTRLYSEKLAKISGGLSLKKNKQEENC